MGGLSRVELCELIRHLETLERRIDDERDLLTRTSWENQAEAIRALIRAALVARLGQREQEP